jgi:hypothetical protein
LAFAEDHQEKPIVLEVLAQLPGTISLTDDLRHEFSDINGPILR